MKYSKKDAKAYAQANMKGVWAAALTPLKQDFAIDETGFRSNLRHWADDLKIDGVFVAGKQGEFFSMSLDERKKLFDIAASELNGKAGTIMSCSDQNMDTVIELAKHAQKCGADYIVVHAPILHFTHKQDESLYQYYKYLSDNLDIGIAMWSHPDSGYLMSPELCAKIAELPTVVAIKYSVPRDMYAKLTKLAGDKILVSTASEEEWLDNILELNWQVYLCSSPPYLIQTVMGAQTASYPTPEHVLALLRELPDQTVWLCSGIGPFQLPLTTLALSMGGHARVGLEDNLYYARGRKFKDNAEAVRRVVRIAGELNRKVATPAQTRQLLGLPDKPNNRPTSRKPA